MHVHAIVVISRSFLAMVGIAAPNDRPRAARSCEAIPRRRRSRRRRRSCPARRSRLIGGVFGFFGEYEEVVENLLREGLIGQEFAGFVGDDEIIGALAITHGKRMMFLVLNDTDDLKL